MSMKSNPFVGSYSANDNHAAASLGDVRPGSTDLMEYPCSAQPMFNRDVFPHTEGWGWCITVYSVTHIDESGVPAPPRVPVADKFTAFRLAHEMNVGYWREKGIDAAAVSAAQ